MEKELRARGYKVEVLDGDVVRENLSKGLGFSKEDRDTNIRRIGFVCELLTRNDVVAIAAAISPYREIRDENRARVGGRFVEVYAKCPLEVLAERDVKGLYKKAMRGEIKNFTGVDDPYEAPENPEVVLESDKETPAQSAAKVIEKLVELKYIPSPRISIRRQSVKKSRTTGTRRLLRRNPSTPLRSAQDRSSQ